MARVYDDVEQQAARGRTREYSSGSSARHRTGRSMRRVVFFGIASIWGFIAGVAGVLAAMSATGNPVSSRAAIALGLVPCAIMAVAGGFVIAAAYTEWKRRSRF